MTEQSLFTTKASETAALLIGSQSIFKPLPGMAMASYLPDVRHIDPDTQTTGDNAKLVFTIPDDCDIILPESYLRVAISALTPGAGATFTRLCEDAGCTFFEVSEAKIGPKSFSFVDKEEIFGHVRDFVPHDKRDGWNRRLGMGLTPAERNTLALGEQVFLIPLMWQPFLRPDLGLKPTLYSNHLKLHLQVAPFATLVETDSQNAAPFTFTCQLVANVAQVDRETRLEFAKATLENGGLTQCVPYYQYDDNHQVAAATNIKTMKIEGFNMPTRRINVLIREAADATANAVKPFNFKRSNMPDSFQLKSNGVFIIHPQNTMEQMEPINNWYKGETEAPAVIRLQFDRFPCNQRLSDGGLLGFDSLPNPIFQATWLAGAPTDLTVRFQAETFNWMISERGALDLLYK